MEELYEILEDIIPGEDYKNSTALVDDDILPPLNWYAW